MLKVDLARPFRILTRTAAGGRSQGPLPPVRTGRGLAVLMAAAVLLAGRAAHGQGFRAELDRKILTLGESAALTLEFEGGSPAGKIVIPAVAGLRIVDGNQVSQNVSINNGEISSVEARVYVVTASQIGDFTIPAMTATINGRTVSSAPLTLSVVKPGATGTPEIAMLRMVLPKNEVYVGEAFPAELQLWLQEGVVDIRDPQLTPIQGEGFTTGKMVQGQARPGREGNTGYKVIPLSYLFTAVKAGDLTLGPADCKATLLLPPVNFFGQPTRSLAVDPIAEPQTIRVLPLPKENVPPGFAGAVGSYSLQVQVSPTNVAVGDPITVKARISGRGALENVTLPEQTSWGRFKVYPPTSDFQPADSDPLGRDGTKTFAVTVVPESTEIRELPPFVFSFFDPNQRRYQTLRQPAVALTVRPSAASLPPTVAAGNAPAADNNPAPGQDIVYIKARPGTLGQLRAPLVLQPWFLALQGIPLLTWISLLVGRKQRERLAGNPRLRRQRLVDHIIRDGLKELRQAAAVNDREAFFSTLFRLLQERLGERLDLPASAITEAVVDEQLPDGTATEEMKSSLRELFHTCNQARYAGESTPDELVSVLDRAEAALAELKRIKA